MSVLSIGERILREDSMLPAFNLLYSRPNCTATVVALELVEAWVWVCAQAWGLGSV